MSNTNAPFGFRQFGRLDGGAPTGGIVVRTVDNADTTPIYTGDPVTSLTTGYVAQSSPGTTQIAGIFLGCKYLSSAIGRMVWSPYWPGSGASQDVEAYICNDPAALFIAQSNGSPIVFADINSNIQFAIGSGNAANGQSGATLNQSTLNTTATLPFRIVGVYQGVGNGGDAASNYNWAIVAFNNQDFKSLTGIA